MRRVLFDLIELLGLWFAISLRLYILGVAHVHAWAVAIVLWLSYLGLRPIYFTLTVVDNMNWYNGDTYTVVVYIPSIV